jgi:hypothetical protein
LRMNQNASSTVKAILDNGPAGRYFILSLGLPNPFPSVATPVERDTDQCGCCGGLARLLVPVLQSSRTRRGDRRSRKSGRHLGQLYEPCGSNFRTESNFISVHRRMQQYLRE